MLPGELAAAQPRLFDQYTLTSWTDEEGLFGGWIVGLAQDSHGYLWIGTVSGLIRFDGLDFERFHGTAETRLPQRSVSAIHAARDGSVWVGFSGGGGIYRIQQQRILEYGQSEGLSAGRTTAFIEDVDGAMLAVTPDGLYRLGDDRWAKLGPAEGLPDGQVQVFAAYQDRGGALWAVTSDAVFRRQRPRDPFNAVATPDEPSLSLSEAPDGAIWITSPSLGYGTLGPQHPEASAAVRRQGIGYRLLHDRAGNMWVATLGQGLWFVRNGRGVPEVVGTHNGLSNNTVRCVFEDRNGDVWVGTTVGLHRFARRRVTPITDLGVVRAVAAAKNGDVWVGTTDGLVRFSEGERHWYGTKDGLASGNIHSMYIGPSGTLWVSTAAGIAVFANNRFSPLPLTEGQWPSSGSSTIVADDAGNLWICTEDRGVFRWRNGRLLPVALPDISERGAVHSVSIDSKARLWFMLGGGGIGVIDREGAFSLVRESDKFHRSDLAVHEDARGTVWLGSGGRLSRFKDGALSAITAANGLPQEAIRAIVTDNDGNLWIGTSGGIIRVGDGEFDLALVNSTRRVDFRSYTSSDGLPGAPVRLGYPNAVRSADGHLWFVTGNGITVVDPHRLSTARPTPAVRITRVNANGHSFEPGRPFELPPRTTGFQIDYTALEFVSPRQVQFRYRLEGFDDTWTDAGSRRQALFTHLPPGNYRFRVIARSSEGIWNTQGAVIDFSIQPMFYQTRLFTGLCATVTFAIALLTWRLRRGQVRRRFALILSERARMAREIHDTLLQSLAGLELQVDAVSSQLQVTDGPVREQLERIRRQIQFDVSEARQSIWGLRSATLETRDLAAALRDLGQSMADSSGVCFEFSVSGTPARCTGTVEEHLLRVGREAVSNAIRHAHAKRLRLELHYDADSITLRVRDDGCGFDVTEAAGQRGAHWGLATMRERAAAIGADLKVVSQPGAGTNLEMIAPLLSPSNG